MYYTDAYINIKSTATTYGPHIKTNIPPSKSIIPYTIILSLKIKKDFIINNNPAV